MKSLMVENFAAFGHAEFRFSPALNVFIGENGTGKTLLMKLPYAVMRVHADETWRNTCQLLGGLPVKGPREHTAAQLLGPLEKAMGGRVVHDSANDRFYLQATGTGKTEMPLVAEGIRKLGMLVRLAATGALVGRGCLFWDEPETNLNPQLIRRVAHAILEICALGVAWRLGYPREVFTGAPGNRSHSCLKGEKRERRTGARLALENAPAASSRTALQSLS